MELQFVQLDQKEFKTLIEITVNKAIREALSDQKEKEKLMSLKDASIYLNLSTQTLYSYTSRKNIPFLKKGKKILFRKEAIDTWLKEGNSYKWKNKPIE